MSERFAILADVHANTSALREVFAYLDKEQVDTIYCLGDLVGYNADPSTCLKMLRGRNLVTIGGNHDRYVATGQVGEIRPATVQAVEFTRRTLSGEEIAFLSSLQDQKVVRDAFLLVHGSPRDRDEYILTAAGANANLAVLQEKFLGIDICFFGHCHIPMIVGNGKVETQFSATRTVALERYRTYLINPGSVGQPRDRCRDTSFGIFDPGAWAMTVVRLPYPVEETQAQIAAAGLDLQLAKRLELGI
ncbi:MAG: metallophosphoesterase family protein [Planctomycetes bacterium]|nr:metallophosphoesterase family protein [Planctomycetota bacterium]